MDQTNRDTLPQHPTGFDSTRQTSTNIDNARQGSTGIDNVRQGSTSPDTTRQGSTGRDTVLDTILGMGVPLTTVMEFQAKRIPLEELLEVLQNAEREGRLSQLVAAERRKDLKARLTLRPGTDQPLCTGENFLAILREDPRFAGVRYNMLKLAPDRTEQGRRIPWTDMSDAAARNYIEANYGIFHPKRYADAFDTLMSERCYHPVRELIGGLRWDGKLRCEEFFLKWMNVEDTPYSREVGRLFFAGAIHRAFLPGCKVDHVPVLIGDQGAGKSTLCRWLAMDDDFYSSIKTISGQRGYESIHGKWIVEIEELLAVLACEKQGQKMEEAAKAFLSTNSDYYRHPYDRRSQDNPRQCVFIGTTNRSEFLTDRTGNRRWFPLRVSGSASRLYTHEDEVKEDIRQCWAEMAWAFLDGDPQAAPVPRRDLFETFRAEQSAAEVDDWRTGVLGDYLKGREKVCLIQLWREALHPDQRFPPDMTRRDAGELAEILTHQLGWVRGKNSYFPKWGTQKTFLAPYNLTFSEK